MGKPKHDRLGNCWCPEAIYHRGCSLGADTDPDVACDVCHKHDEPRGSCSECPKCPACSKEARRHD